MLRLILAGIAVMLAVMNRGNEVLAFYWTLVCVYWATNYYNGKVNR